MSSSSIARRVAAAVLAAGAVVAAAAVPATADDHRGRGEHWAQRSSVVISDVQPDSPRREYRSHRALNAEWVEITNNGRRGVDLDGWTLRDSDGNRYRFHDYRLPGRATVRVHTGSGRDTRTDLYQDRRHSMWDSRSDRAVLRDDRGNIVDTESWGRWH